MKRQGFVLELQLTKLSRPTTKIIKRVAPGSETEAIGNQQVVQTASGNKAVTRKTSSAKSAEKRTNDTRSQVRIAINYLFRN